MAASHALALKNARQEASAEKALGGDTDPDVLSAPNLTGASNN